MIPINKSVEELYEEASNALLQWGPAEFLETMKRYGRIMVIGTYLDEIHGGDLIIEGKFNDDTELASPPYYTEGNETFEAVVEREYKEYGYSPTLEISIEDYAAPEIETDASADTLSHLHAIKKSFEDGGEFHHDYEDDILNMKL